MPPIDDRKVFELIGEAGFTDLIGRFYAKVRDDDLIGPMYPPDDWEAAEARLRMFLIQRFGGPMTYSQQRGHPRLRMRHDPFPIDQPAAERWLALMNQSMKECLSAGTVNREAAGMLWPFFVGTATFMINRKEPDERET